MTRTLTSCKVLIVTASWLLSVSTTGWAEVDLLFDPPTQSLEIDDLLDIDIVARSSDGTQQLITTLDAVLDWDPLVLELLGADNSNAGYAWFADGFLSDPDGINDGIDVVPIGVPNNDGDAIYTALAAMGSPATTGPADLVVTTIRFRALQLTSGTVVSFTPLLGSFGETRVLGTGLQNDITGDISETAIVEVVCNAMLYGDVNQDESVDADDVSCMTDALSGLSCPGVSMNDLDIFPCLGNGELNLYDLLAVLDTLGGSPPCPDGCP